MIKSFFYNNAIISFLALVTIALSIWKHIDNIKATRSTTFLDILLTIVVTIIYISFISTKNTLLRYGIFYLFYGVVTTFFYRQFKFPDVVMAILFVPLAVSTVCFLALAIKSGNVKFR